MQGSGEQLPLADNDEDYRQVVHVGVGNFAILDNATDDLVRVLLQLELVIALLDEVSLSGEGGTTW